MNTVAAEPLVNIVVGGIITLVGSIVVALITSKKVINSQEGHAGQQQELLTSLRDEVIARNRVVTHAIDRAVYETDAEGSCVFVNREWSKLTGVPPQEAFGRGWMRGLHPDDAIQVRLAWDHAINNQEKFGPMRFKYIRASGEINTVVSEAYPTRNGGGRLRGYVGWMEEVL